MTRAPQKARRAPPLGALTPVRDGLDSFGLKPPVKVPGAGRREAGLGNADPDELPAPDVRRAGALRLVTPRVATPALSIVVEGMRPMLVPDVAVAVPLALVNLCVFCATIEAAAGPEGALCPCCRFGRCTPANRPRAFPVLTEVARAFPDTATRTPAPA